MIFAIGLVAILVVLPLAMTWKNLQQFHRACKEQETIRIGESIGVSLLIPARNEAKGIEKTLRSILGNRHSLFEVIVLDDHSEDGTSEIVDRISQEDSRVRRIPSKPLPEGWNGKQHACWQAAQEATHPILMFLDADVRLTPDAITRCVAESLRAKVPLISGFPKQETQTWSEQMLIPMMYVVLLGYLPIHRMRGSKQPGFAAGCGQLFLAEKSTYLEIGGHQAIFDTRHDGIKLPRRFRESGHGTDIFDASDIATCRMYTNCAEVIQGLLKNASEGIANASLILPFTILLGGANLAPWMLLALDIYFRPMSLGTIVIVVLALLGLLPRTWCNRAFGQPQWTLLVQPLTVTWFLGLQWIALLRRILGIQTLWRGRN